MSDHEKSLKLAELMGWKLTPDEKSILTTTDAVYGHLDPYGRHRGGMAQFAAILLKYPMVITSFIEAPCCGYEQCCGELRLASNPTQEQILDEVLRMEGGDER